MPHFDTYLFAGQGQSGLLRTALRSPPTFEVSKSSRAHIRASANPADSGVPDLQDDPEAQFKRWALSLMSSLSGPLPFGCMQIFVVVSFKMS